MKLYRFKDHVVEGVKITIEKDSIDRSTDIAGLWKNLQSTLKDDFQEAFMQSLRDLLSEFPYEIIEHTTTTNQFEFILDGGDETLFLVDINFNWEHPIRIAAVPREPFAKYKGGSFFKLHEAYICAEKDLKSAFAKLEQFKQRKKVYLRAYDKHMSYTKNVWLELDYRPKTIDEYINVIREELPKQEFIPGRMVVEFFVKDKLYTYENGEVRQVS